MKPPHRARDAKVEQARLAVGAEEDVVRGHVAVDDVERLAALARRNVRGVQSLERTREDRHHAPHGDRLPPLDGGLRELGKYLAVDVVHHEEELAFGGHDVERGDHVGVADPRGDARFVEEHRDEPRVARVLGVKAFDGDGAGEAHRADQAPEEHRSHPPGCDRLVQSVPSDHGDCGASGHDPDGLTAMSVGR